MSWNLSRVFSISSRDFFFILEHHAAEPNLNQWTLPSLSVQPKGHLSRALKRFVFFSVVAVANCLASSGGSGIRKGLSAFLKLVLLNGWKLEVGDGLDVIFACARIFDKSCASVESDSKRRLNLAITE